MSLLAPVTEETADALVMVYDVATCVGRVVPARILSHAEGRAVLWAEGRTISLSSAELAERMERARESRLHDARVRARQGRGE